MRPPQVYYDLNQYFFVNKIIFFITLSRKICFTTVMHLSNQKVDLIFKAFASIFKYYYQRSFQLMVGTADGEFKPLDKLMVDLPGAQRLNLTAANKHRPYVKRKICVIKERVWAVRHSLPFLQIPTQTTHMVFFVVKLLIFFSSEGWYIGSVQSKSRCVSGDNKLHAMLPSFWYVLSGT
jgi:hypothetical protein